MPEITSFNLGLLIVGTAAALLTVRSAKDMTNRALLRDRSFLGLMCRLAKRHWVALVVVGIILGAMIAVLKVAGLIVAVTLISWWARKCYRHVRRYRKRSRYVRAIEPRHASQCLPVKLNRRGGARLGGQHIHYVFLSHRHKTLTFPEAATGSHHRYYLLRIRFKPKYGPRYNRLTYRRPFKIRGHASMDHRAANIVEIPSTAVVKLISTDLSKVTHVHLHNEISNVVDHLRRGYVLSQHDKQALNLI